MNWLVRYYDQRVASGGHNFLEQVVHTEQGRPISDGQFQTMLRSIQTKLNLHGNDVFLDLCCGNGIFTQPLACSACQTVGVDFSNKLISVARKHHQAENLTYHVHDVKKLGDLSPLVKRKFSKILMNAALQHFTAQEFKLLLQTLLKHSTADRVMLFSFAPNLEKRKDFEKSLKINLQLRLRRLMGRDLVGKWWGKLELSKLCQEMGLKVAFLEVDPEFEGARYRFDIKIS